jgi:hypothetical protein
MLRTTIRKPASEPDRTICHRMRHRANPSDPIRKRPGLTMRALTFASTSKGTWSAGAAFQIASSVTLGGGLGLLAWTPGHTPALGALFPMLWIGRPSRVAAFACAVAYHLAVVRFLPGFAANWFGSIVAGFACWLAVGFVSGLVWAVLWPPSGSKALRVMLSALAVLVMLLLPPFGALVPAHPVVAWGYLAPGSGWVGVALMFILTPTAAAWLRTHERVFPESHVFSLWSASLVWCPNRMTADRRVRFSLSKRSLAASLPMGQLTSCSAWSAWGNCPPCRRTARTRLKP